ncbi:hypothetical protein AB0N95_35240 [Streptomyces microflavus]|uniref:hypothetical protein n=2 Tax=Streptomyces microflavus TaxID=1919 RepID=UPI003413F8DD
MPDISRVTGPATDPPRRLPTSAERRNWVPGLDLEFPIEGPVVQREPGEPPSRNTKAVIPAGEPDLQRPVVDAIQARFTVMRPSTTTPYLNRTMDRWFTPQEHLARFTSKVLVLPRGPRWEEAVSTALLGDWDTPLKQGQGLDDDTVVGQIRAEARTLHRQLVPVWRRRVRSSRMLLLETPLGDGLTLHDLVAGGLREDLIFEAAFDDPRLAAVLDGLTPEERAVAMAWAHPAVGSWTEAARLAGHTSPEAFGERVRRKLKRLGAQHTARAAAARGAEQA